MRVDRAPVFYPLVILVSLVLSVWAAYHETVINPDGICYLLGAQSFTNSPLKQTVHLCAQAQWPFYSFLIYGLSHIAPFSYQTSAFILNSLFSVLSLLAFLKIVEQLGGTQRVLWLAALVFLLAHDFNNLRQSIIRDHGYWAAYLWSISAMLYYLQKPSWYRAGLWSVCMLIAALFRIEGVIFLALVPLLILVPFKHYLQLNTLLLVLLLCCLTVLFFSGAENLGRLNEITAHFQNGLSVIFHRYKALTDALSHTLTLASHKDIAIVAILTQIFWYLAILMSSLTFIYFLLAMYGFRKQSVLLTYIGINIFITFIFLLENGFLSKRYIAALSLTLMLYVPFALDSLWRKRRKLFYVALVAMIATGIGGIYSFGYSKAFLHDAGKWMALNVPHNANVYANDASVMYYSQHFDTNIFNTFKQYHDPNTIDNGQWKKFDYLALRLSDEQDRWSTIANTIALKPIQVFKNKRGDRVAIYKVEN